ncbi:unnamed protein product [Toxocara canis]|nr:unnamed protein product [Toxocara canis]
MSPYAIYLSNDQQEALYELISEARKAGAVEAIIKEHVVKYLAQILGPQKLAEFNEANERFEKERRGKRAAKDSLSLPKTSMNSTLFAKNDRRKERPQKFAVKSDMDINVILKQTNEDRIV